MRQQRRLTMGLVGLMLWLGSCTGVPDEAGNTEISQTTPETTDTIPENFPTIGVFNSARLGDLLCYVTVTSREGKTSEVGASADLCDRSPSLTNQTLRFIYDDAVMPQEHCNNTGLCGANNRQTVISDVVMLGENWQVLSNGTWTVTVGQAETWDGRNNTGNLTYYGCNDQNDCLALTEGKITCRDGVCHIGWQQDDYFYILSTPIVEDGGAGTTLRVHQGGDDLLNVPDMQVIDSSL